MNKMSSKSYSELSQLSSYEERYNYLKTTNSVGKETFGLDRYLNQKFYRSMEWKNFRDQIIIRDNGCDMGLEGYPIRGDCFIHHINPLTSEDILLNSEKLLDPNNAVLVSRATHNAIHYGDDTIVKDKKIIERTPNDMCPWRK